MAVGAVVGFVAGLVVAVGLEVGFAVGAAVGLVVDAVVGFAVAEGFAVALLPEDGLLTVLLPELGFVVADGFAVALGFDTVLPVELEDDGLLVVLFSVLDEADELLPSSSRFCCFPFLHSVSPWVLHSRCSSLQLVCCSHRSFPIPCYLPHWMWSSPLRRFRYCCPHTPQAIP